MIVNSYDTVRPVTGQSSSKSVSMLKPAVQQSRELAAFVQAAGAAVLVGVFVVLVDLDTEVAVASGARTTFTLAVVEVAVSDCHVSETVALPLLGTVNE